jgi:molecular chaperone DnaK
VIPNRAGELVTPSVVAFSTRGRVLVGRAARTQAAVNPERTVVSIKRLMGLESRVVVGSRPYSAQEISALILRQLKEDAEVDLGEPVREVVLTVPAYFNDRQRQATVEAAALAGLGVQRLLNEPTAAALAYGLGADEARTIMVWDLGGGTFDVSLLELGDGVFEVRAVSGDNSLGGDDFDAVVMEWLAEIYHEQHWCAYPADGRSQARLRDTAEKAKVQLSQSSRTRVFLPFVERRPYARHLHAELDRVELERRLGGLLGRLETPTRQVLADAGLPPSKVDAVILVGNGTRLPAVRRVVTRIMGQEPLRWVDPDLITAMGAAIGAGIHSGLVKRAVLLDVLPLSLGAETHGGIFQRIIPRNTPLPASSSQVFTTAVDNQGSMAIRVFQGERALCTDNITLGTFELDGLPPAPRGLVKVEVGLEVDVDGMVQAVARDLLGEGQANARFVSTLRLDPSEAQQLVEEADLRDADDQERAETVRAGIEAESAIRAVELAVEALADRVDDPRLEDLVDLAQHIREALGEQDAVAVRAHCERVRDLLSTLAEASI